MLQHNSHQSSLPAQSAWAGVYLLYSTLAFQVPVPFQSMAMVGGLFGVLAGVGLEQSRKRCQMTLLHALSIRQHILLQTRGRLHDLTVRVSNGRTSVEGYAPSYDLMQLAHSAALDIVGPGESALEFKMRVRKARSATC